jgi:hypothetical protein
VMGIRGGLLPPDEALAYPLTDEVRQHVEQSSQNAIDGDPQQVRDRVLQIAEAYQTTEVGIVTNCYDFDARVRSYELVAEVFGLTPREEPSNAARAV